MRPSPSGRCPAAGWTNCGWRWRPGHTDRATFHEPPSGRGPATIRRYLAWRQQLGQLGARHSPDVIAVLKTNEMLIAAVTNNTIPLIFAAVLVVWYRFSQYVPARAADFMNDTVEPRGWVAVLVALVVVAILGGVVVAALRLNRFTLIRDGDVLRNSRGLLGKQSGTIPVNRIQAVRIVEGFWRRPLGYCTLQVEVAGIGRANTNQRMLFPLVRTDRARALITPGAAGTAVADRTAAADRGPRPQTYKTLPLSYGAGFAALMLFLPGWWKCWRYCRSRSGTGWRSPGRGWSVADRPGHHRAPLVAAAQPADRSRASGRHPAHRVVAVRRSRPGRGSPGSR